MPFFVMLPCEAVATKRGRGRERESERQTNGLLEWQSPL